MEQWFGAPRISGSRSRLPGSQEGLRLKAQAATGAQCQGRPWEMVGAGGCCNLLEPGCRPRPRAPPPAPGSGRTAPLGRGGGGAAAWPGLAPCSCLGALPGRASERTPATRELLLGGGQAGRPCGVAGAALHCPGHGAHPGAWPGSRGEVRGGPGSPAARPLELGREGSGLGTEGIRGGVAGQGACPAPFRLGSDLSTHREGKQG